MKPEQVIFSVEQEPEPPAQMQEGLALVSTMALSFAVMLGIVFTIIAIGRLLRKKPSQETH